MNVFRHDLIIKRGLPVVLPLEFESFNELWQALIVDLKSEGREVPVPDKRGMDLTDLAVILIPADL